MKRIVVTGATGFLGRNLVEELLHLGEEVIVIVREPDKIPNSWKKRVTILKGSLNDLITLETDLDAEIFYHFAWAGTSGPERADYNLQIQNISAACGAVELAERMGCKRFVYAGSIMEYETQAYIPSAGAKPGKASSYSIAKMAGDYFAKTIATNKGIEYINVLISNIYGIGEYSARFLNTTIRKMLNQETLLLSSGNQMYDFIYISDAVRMIIYAAEHGEKNAEYYIGNREQKTLKSFVLIMKEILGSNSELKFGAYPATTMGLTYKEFETCSLYKMGFKVEITFEEGIRRTAEWIRCNREKGIGEEKR